MKSFTVERNIDLVPSNIETSVVVTNSADPAVTETLRFAASASGSGMQTGSKSDVTCAMDSTLEPMFDFFDKMMIKMANMIM